jgi:hypothetical protein
MRYKWWQTRCMAGYTSTCSGSDFQLLLGCSALFQLTLQFFLYIFEQLIPVVASVFGKRIVAQMEKHGGLITEADLADYEPEWDEPIATTYRGYEVLCPPPPCSGLQYLQTLNIVEECDLAALGLSVTRTEWIEPGDAVQLPAAGLHVFAAGQLQHAGATGRRPRHGATEQSPPDRLPLVTAVAGQLLAAGRVQSQDLHLGPGRRHHDQEVIPAVVL